MNITDLALYSRNITEQLIENHGELTPEIEKELANVDQELSLKVDKYNFVMERLSLEEKYWKDKAELYIKISKSCKRVKEELKTRIKDAMLLMDKSEIAGLDYIFKLVNQGNAVEIPNEDNVPAKYLKEKIVYKLDKKMLLDDLRNGEHIEGCALRDVKSLRIYPRREK